MASMVSVRKVSVGTQTSPQQTTQTTASPHDWSSRYYVDETTQPGNLNYIPPKVSSAPTPRAETPAAPLTDRMWESLRGGLSWVATMGSVLSDLLQ